MHRRTNSHEFHTDILTLVGGASTLVFVTMAPCAHSLVFETSALGFRV